MALDGDNLVLVEQIKMLAGMPEEVRRRIAVAAQALEFGAGEFVFRSDDGDDFSHFLVVGKVDLIGPGGLRRQIKADSAGADRSLESNARERWDCRAVVPVKVLRVPEGVLDVAFGQPRARSGYVVRELAPADDEPGPGPTETDADADAEDWMERLLQAPLFHDVPVDSLFDLFQKLESVPVRAGEVVIHQGDAGEHCYVLSRGQAEVLLKTRKGDRLRLAVKYPGQIFGEEALLTNAPRNATVRMTTDGEVRRLSAPDFHRLLAAPVLASLDAATAMVKLAEQNGIWLDVRLMREPDAELESKLRPEFRNIPVPLLRSRIPELDRRRPIVAFCEDGRLSSVAVFLLRGRGRSAWVLKGGVEALRKQLGSC